MSFIKCFDVINMVVEEANNRFSPLWKINNDKLSVLKQYSEAIDKLSKEFSGVSFDVEVDEISMEITIALECDEIIIEDEKHLFYELAKRTVRYSFSVSEDKNLLVKFVFPSVWEKV